MARKNRRQVGDGEHNRIIVERAVDACDAGPPRLRGGSRRRPARSVRVNLAESPLGWLHAHGHIDARQYQAGERLRTDFEMARLGPAVTMRWDAVPISGTRRGAVDHLEAGERQIFAKRRFDDALAVIGSDLNDVAWRVICVGESVPAAERALGWPARSGKLVLRLALDRLANHYRLA